MHLLSKVRTLVGALLHAPFTPEPEKAESKEEPAAAPASPQAVQSRERTGLEGQSTEVPDDTRVADIIARRKEGGQ